MSDEIGDSGEPQVKRRGVGGRGLAVASFVVPVLALGAAAAFVVFGQSYSEIPSEGADVVVILGGGGPRLEEGVRLVEEGVGPELVVFRTVDPNQRWQAAHGLCSRWEPVKATCLEPDPSDTRGEAVALAQAVEERGWQSAVVVVSHDQAVRARSLIERCSDGLDVHMVGVEHRHPKPVRVIYEALAMFRDGVLRPGC